MADYTGHAVVVPHRVDDTLRCSASIAAMTVHNPTLYEPISMVEPIGANTRSANAPIQENELNYTGRHVTSFLDDYYYRMHVVPANFAFGAVLSDIIDTFIVWNSFFVRQSCSDITFTYPDEFSLAGTEDPYTLSGLELATYTITIPKEGSASFISTITFDFGAAGERVVTMSGTRMIVFAFVPEIEVQESLEWLTDIIKPNDGIGSEQRFIVRKIPRQAFSYSIKLQTAQEQARFDAAIFGWHKRYFGLPIWTEKVRHITTITAGAATITVDTTNADFRDASYAVIWKSLTEYEAVKITTVAAGSLTLDLPVVATYTGVKYIIPCRITQVKGNIERTNDEVAFSRVQVNFAVKDNILLTGFTATQTYLGLPVILTGSVIGIQDKSYSSDSDSFAQDYEAGDFDYYSDSEFNFLGQNWTFYNDTRAKCWDFRLFLHSLLGRQGTCWMPTYREDVVATDVIGAADMSFHIVNIELASNMTYNALRTHLAFIFSDGTVICKKITGIVEADETEEVVSMDTSLGVEVPIGGCIISFLDLNRQASDLVEIDWLEHNKNSVNQVFMMVKE